MKAKHWDLIRLSWSGCRQTSKSLRCKNPDHLIWKYTILDDFGTRTWRIKVVKAQRPIHGLFIFILIGSLRLTACYRLKVFSGLTATNLNKGLMKQSCNIKNCGKLVKNALQKPAPTMAILKDPNRLSRACYSDVVVSTWRLTPPVIFQAFRPSNDLECIHPVQLIVPLTNRLWRVE